MKIVQIDVNGCKCESPAEGLVLKMERYVQRLTQGDSAHEASYTCVPGLHNNRAQFPED